MKIILPDNVKKIISILVAQGFEAYAVGGCIRDSILGRIPDDWDITTSAKPHEVKNLFKRTVETGIVHGTITILIDNESYEITTYRIDGEYEDSRHPKEVTFTSNLIEDLKRRDFTINAMAYNDAEGIIDCFDGMADIQEKKIRCVGNPEERFSEDALRIMRAIRFSAQLGYDIEDRTKEAISKLAPTLINISAERIQVELIKLVVSNHPEKMRDLYEMGITKVIMPEFDEAMETTQNHPHHMYSVGEHTIHSMEEVKADKVLRFTMLFHDFGKPRTKQVGDDGIEHFYGHEPLGEEMAKAILQRLKFDNDTINKVTKLVHYHDWKINTTRKSVRHAVSIIGEDLFPLLLLVKKADTLAQSDFLRKEKLEELSTLDSLFLDVINNMECVSLKTLAVTGKDLIDAGMTPGKEIGIALKSLLEIVIDDPAQNTKENLLKKLLEV